MEHPYTGSVKMKLKKDHVLLIFECMFGAVFARNPFTKEVKYFDFDYDGARAFAQIDKMIDLRIAKHDGRGDVYDPSINEPNARRRSTCLYGITCNP